MVETIPVAGIEAEDTPFAEHLSRMMKSAAHEPLATGPPLVRPGVPTAAVLRKIEYGGSVPFRRSRTILAAICAAISLVFAGSFGWWYWGTVDELDAATTAAGERRRKDIQKRAAPIDLRKIPGTTTTVTTVTTTIPLDERVSAPKTLEINEMLVGISSARVGPLEGGDPNQEVFTLGLRITNHSVKLMKYVGWAQPGVKVTLRDAYGNHFNRISADTTERIIPVGETITDRLIFEKITFSAEVTLDLPAPGIPGQFYKFRIAAQFIERPGFAQRMIDAAAGSKALPLPNNRLSLAPPNPTPAEPPPAYDPETDPKLLARLRSDYDEKMSEINRRKLGMGSNESTNYKRRETAKLIKRLAKENDLTEKQVKRMVGPK
jgi:hypothetical protein